ncbi:unnamed protein product [Dicrocoelium dendriticum]|nr:unnamed protein product [Dicrocoelium dendriticum]
MLVCSGPHNRQPHPSWADVPLGEAVLLSSVERTDNSDGIEEVMDQLCRMIVLDVLTNKETIQGADSRGEKKLTLKREAGPFTNKKVVRDVLQATATERFFPTTIEVDLDIHDHDVDEDQRIARFRREFPVFETGQTELRLGADVRVEVLVKIDCETDYYGQQCEVYCLPMPELWDCNPVNGARICSKPCEHGSCVLTNTSAVCICAAGWSGEFCKLPSESSLITSMILPEMPVNPSLQTVGTPTFNLEDGSNGDIIPPKLFLETSLPVAEYGETEFANAGESDGVFTYAPIVSLGRMNFSEIENSSDASQKSNDSVMAITAVAFGVTGAQRPFRLLVVVTSVAVTAWIILMIVIGVLCHRRRGKKFGSSHPGPGEVQLVRFQPSNGH